ncbi:MAG: HPF/RaiA family ribosome-associated protein [Burkholderiaceae bacterium]|nr:HPF/RaiA family ribosome-associated protein [Burkholderiaceae bacterium]
MQVQVHTNDHIQGGESLASWIQDETINRLARFREHITRVEVFLTDVDAGKSGANDKRCRLEARPAGRQPVTVTADGDKVAVAYVSAVDKLIHALDADLGRAKDRHARDTIGAHIADVE